MTKTAILLTEVVIDGRLATCSLHYSAPEAEWDENLAAFEAAVESFALIEK